MTKQDEARQDRDKTRQDETRRENHKTRQDMKRTRTRTKDKDKDTRQNKTRQDRTRQDKTIHDTTRQEKRAVYKIEFADESNLLTFHQEIFKTNTIPLHPKKVVGIRVRVRIRIRVRRVRTDECMQRRLRRDYDYTKTRKD
jgi:hypothetical protein